MFLSIDIFKYLIYFFKESLKYLSIIAILLLKAKHKYKTLKKKL